MEPRLLLLLAEDEYLIGMNLQDALQDAGYAVRYVMSGDEAIAVIEDAEVKLSGIITDIRLGKGPQGWDVARRAREINPHIAMVYITGDSTHNHGSSGVPCSVVLQKPFAPAHLISAISSLINGAPKVTD